jgi:hypothetical protein
MRISIRNGGSRFPARDDALDLTAAIDAGFATATFF